MALPNLFEDASFLAFYPAVAAVALFGGMGPGLTAALFSALVHALMAGYKGSPALMVGQIAVFLAGSAGVSVLAGLQQRSRARERAGLMELRESEARIRKLFKADLLGIGYSTKQGAFLDANDKLLRMIDYTREDLVEGRVRWDKMTPTEYAGLDAVGIAEADQHHSCMPYEKEYIRKDGTRVPILIGYTREDEDRYVVFVLDLTRQKEVERQLVAAKQNAEEANKAKDHFLATLSHELRTPLSPVTTGLAILQHKNLDQDVREVLEVIRRNVELQARLIDDLLDVTRVVQGKLELDQRHVELCIVIDRTVEVCRADIQARGLHFGVDYGDGRPYVIHADMARLQQVFWNLLKNSVKFTPPGGCIGIHIREESNNAVTVDVTDSGVGIDPDLLQRIFLPFEQGGSVVTRNFGGLGLGLAISKAIVELHGGTITAHSEGKGRGASFRVTVPLVASRTSAQTMLPTPEARKPPRPLHILVVEDHEDTAANMQDLLAMEGHSVEIAGDVAAAVDMATRKSFHVMVSDLGLPDGSGLDLMRELRRRGNRIPGIALTGYGQEEDLRRSREAGFAAHITKPPNPERLFEAIAAVTS